MWNSKEDGSIHYKKTKNIIRYVIVLVEYNKCKCFGDGAQRYVQQERQNGISFKGKLHKFIHRIIHK